MIYINYSRRATLWKILWIHLSASVWKVYNSWKGRGEHETNFVQSRFRHFTINLVWKGEFYVPTRRNIAFNSLLFLALSSALIFSRFLIGTILLLRLIFNMPLVIVFARSRRIIYVSVHFKEMTFIFFPFISLFTTFVTITSLSGFVILYQLNLRKFQCGAAGIVVERVKRVWKIYHLHLRSIKLAISPKRFFPAFCFYS